MMKASRMLIWSTPEKLGLTRVVGDEIEADVRPYDGTDGFMYRILGMHFFPAFIPVSVEEMRDFAEQGIYARAKVLIPRLQKYVDDYERENPQSVLQANLNFLPKWPRSGVRSGG